jgi:hypothetical protein
VEVAELERVLGAAAMLGAQARPPAPREPLRAAEG